ncbi:hypothetical protein HMPREF1987_01942, partial [Peptostreptococcaceae bacterium oral taxon 113 str. W5053]
FLMLRFPREGKKEFFKGFAMYKLLQRIYCTKKADLIVHIAESHRFYTL